jgi:uncharacterized protein YxjI
MFRHRHEEEQQQRQGPAPSGPTQYRMREKIFSIGDDFWIETNRGAKAYKVDGKALRLRNTLNLEDAHGRVVAQVQERWMRMRDVMAIERDGQKIAEVKKAFVNIARDRFSIDLAGRGADMEARGNILDHEYHITQGGRPVAEISKRWFRVRDTYGIEIEPGADDALVLTIAICIDQMAHD